MKSFSLLAATALLAATTVQAELFLALSNETTCRNILKSRDITAHTREGAGNGDCFPLGEDADQFLSLTIEFCTGGHEQCQCELYSDSACNASRTTVISWIASHAGPQFCYAGGLQVAAVRCWYIN